MVRGDHHFREDDLDMGPSPSCLPFGLEWTREQHMANLHASQHRKGRRGLGALVPKRLLGGSSSASAASSSSSHAQAPAAGGTDALSLGSDAAVQSVASVASGADYTVGSTDTVRASNRGYKEEPETPDDGLLRKRWDRIKNALGLRVAPEDHAAAPKPRFMPRPHAYSADYATSNRSTTKRPNATQTRSWYHPTHSSEQPNNRHRPRLGSLERDHSRRARSHPVQRQEQQYMHDQSVTCRWDGLDTIPLGPAGWTLSHVTKDIAEETPPRTTPWQLAMGSDYTATGRSTIISPAQIIHEMLWMSSGNELPEIVLEGFVPGADDRWSVRIEQRELPPSLAPSVPLPRTRPLCFCTDTSWSMAREGRPAETTRSSQPTPPGLVPAHSSSDDYETSEEFTATLIPTVHLWTTLWGDHPPPHPTLEAVQDDDPLLTLAAEHSIPIDLDENTFCVSERSHLETIHSFVSVSLSMGRFETALGIFKKLLKGIELLKDRSLEEQQGLRYLKGSTMHNLGVICLWQGDLTNALMHFQDALQERQRTLPQDHPDIAVSMARKAMVQFALGRYGEALLAMEMALPLTHEKSILGSKLHNNMGVMHFMMRDHEAALREFTASLEIHRMLLDADVRRDAIVFDAATILGNMGKVYMERDNFQLSYYVYEEALLLLTTILRKDHELVLTSLTSLSLVRACDNQTKSALHILQGCLRSQTARFGKESAPCMETMAIMGALYESADCCEDALKYMLQVKKWQKANLPSDHPARRQLRVVVDRLQEKLGSNVTIWV